MDWMLLESRGEDLVKGVEDVGEVWKRVICICWLRLCSGYVTKRC